MKAQSTVKRQLSQLRRECIEGQDDVILKRIAYELECAVRWAREDVVGWPSLADLARGAAQMLRNELMAEALRARKRA